MPLVWLINVLLPFDKRFLVDQKVALLILAVKKAAGSLPQSNLSIHQSWGGREGDQSSSGLGGERLWFQLTVYVFFCLSFFFFFFFKHWGVFPLALTGSSISEDVMTCLDFVFNMNFPFFKDFSHYEGCHEDGGRFLVISLIPQTQASSSVERSGQMKAKSSLSVRNDPAFAGMKTHNQ